MLIQRQVSNLQPGDIVIWHGDIYDAGRLPDTMGMVVNDNPDPHDEHAVLIQFFGRHDSPDYPLHYYHHELDLFLENGEIRIQHG